MIDKLLKLHGIRYVISVDDCYSGITEMEIKAILLSEMSNSLLNFREEILKMGKKERLDDVEQMIEFSGEKEAIIREFLEDFSKEQLLKLHSLISQEHCNKYMTEKERLIGFLDKLKEENIVDEYEVCMSTAEALQIDYEAKGQKFDSILWLIDRSFERVGESSEAGLQLARTIVSRDEGPTNYVYILSALAKDEGKAEEEIEVLMNNGDDEQKYWTTRYKLRMQSVILELHEIVDCCNVLDDFFMNNKEIVNEKLRSAYEKNKKIENQLLEYQVKSGILEYDVQRICRLNEIVSIDIVNRFGINLSRIGHAFDFSERTIRNQQ